MNNDAGACFIACPCICCVSSPDAAPALIAERLTDQQRFDDSAVRHEYALLARDRFAYLSSDEQATILGWIAAGPDLNRIQRFKEEVWGRRLTDEELARAARYWKRDRLALFGMLYHRSGSSVIQSSLLSWENQSIPEFVSYHQSWVGSTGPKSAEELQAMSIGEIVRFLKDWEPADDFIGPSRDGLGQELTTVSHL